MIFPGEDFVPESDGASLRNFDVGESEEKALEELRASARVQAFERVNNGSRFLNISSVIHM